ncbi:hypothetical protein [Sphingomonas bacterium]|uniref:hypothetical protein n=1 Tax=Sphingomonas bacterium TaxID=1895847 RepID=UPI0020C5D52D|nr:hypothetical protein [Sphingomonas bacterium]
MRIGFLFNHDQIHQVAHALPTALAMIAEHPDAEVVIAATNDRLRQEIIRLAARGGREVTVRLLRLRRGSTRLLARLFDKALPITRLGIYRDNLDFFRGLDALVVAEKTSLLLKSRYGLNDLKLIHTRHGAGDRAIGFDKQSARFDHVLVSGRKVRDRLVRDAGLEADQLSTIGYPKFDLMPSPPPRLPMQRNGRPTVLYNPHVSPHLSSWFKHGLAVLEWFAAHPEYNLIFAPHVMLFHRPFVLTIDKLRIDRVGAIPARIANAPNIHIDLGSSACTDMTYTAAADIYLGDVSSQVYEFLHRPRPCLFLDSHAVDYRGDANYRHWQAGEVIGDPAELGDALGRAFTKHDYYARIQRQLFDESFALTAEPSGKRAARAIMGVLSPVAPVELFPQPRIAAAADGDRAVA